MNHSDPVPDLYTEVLGVPSGRRPPNHYELLGLNRFEADETKIHAAVLACSATVRKQALDPDPARAHRVQELLNEIGRAGFVLEDPRQREAYNRQLQSTLRFDRPAPAPAAPPPIPAALPVNEPSLIISRSLFESTPKLPPGKTGSRCPGCNKPFPAGVKTCAACGYTRHPLAPA